jgi:imidazolonepropionase-like amidohydrolase
MNGLRWAGSDNREKVKTGLLCIAVSLSTVSGSYGDEPTLVIENAHVVVGDGVVRDAATVAIAGERIASVSAETPQVQAAKKVDARGMTLMPGLIDTHIHFFGLTAHGEAGFRAQIETLAPKYMKDFLRQGVIRVRKNPWAARTLSS